jgi:EmrB/QacA subfamily drug resistance transporter
LRVQTTRDDTQGRWVLVLCCLAQFMVILDVSIVNVALPSIRADLGFSAVDLQWVVNAYTLTFAGFLLLGGRAADLLGPRRVFVAGLLLFAFASLAGGLSQSQEMLVIARGVQGLGGAIMAPVTLSILTTTFAEGAERNRALAAWGAMGAVGGATGNLLGGLLTDILGWQWILIINLPIGLAAAVAAVRLIPDVRPAPTGRRQFDLAGATSITAGLIVLTYAIVRTDVNGWGSAATLELAAVGLGLIALFLLIERRAERPLVPLRIFRSRTLSAANFVVLLLGASAFAMWYFLSLYLQQVLGYSPIQAGLAFLPMPLTIVVASTQAARLVGRFGPGRVLTGGMLLIGLGMALLSRVPADGAYLANVFVPSVIAAAGIGFSFVPMTIAATNGVAPQEAGLASGLVNTSRQVGGSLGLAVLATLATQRTAAVAGAAVPGAAALTAGFQRAFLVGAGFAFAGAVAGALLLASTRAPTAAASPAGVDA